jgi:uncharacterized tellurite resistance protein B-like protein
MEFLVFIGIWIAFAFIRGLFENWGEGGTGTVSKGAARRMAETQHGRLALRLKKEKVPNEEMDLEVLVFQIKGVVPDVPGGLSVGCLQLFDGDNRPLQIISPEYQEKETLFFRQFIWDSAEDRIFFFDSEALWTDWCGVGGHPALFLVPARSGKQRIRARLSLFPLSQRKVPEFHGGRCVSDATAAAVIDSDFVSLDFPLGYQEKELETEEAVGAAIQLAAIAAHSDGEIRQEELDVIRQSAQKRTSSFSDSAAAKARLQTIARDSLKQAGSSAAQLRSKAVATLRGLDQEEFSLQAIELCVEVLAADGEADPAEMDFVYGLCTDLGIKRDLVREMLGKRVTHNDLKLVQSENEFAILGIDPSMDKEEIRAALNKAFRKWNGQVHNTDPDIAARAKTMLDLIGKARAEFLT